MSSALIDYTMLRKAEFADLPELQLLVENSIKSICCKDYNQKQIQVWVSSIRDKSRWKNVLSHQLVLVACFEDKIVGLASLDSKNHIDFFYIHKDFQKKGIARLLFTAIEVVAKKQIYEELSVEASITAKPFFEAMGCSKIKKQIIVKKGVEFINYKMKKSVYHDGKRI